MTQSVFYIPYSLKAIDIMNVPRFSCAIRNVQCFNTGGSTSQIKTLVGGVQNIPVIDEIPTHFRIKYPNISS